MDEHAIDLENARRLGHDVATTSHEALPPERVEQLATVTEDIAGALESGSTTTATQGLLHFWAGHVAGDLGNETDGDDLQGSKSLFEDGFEAGALGVDLYQALTKVATATENQGTTPDLDGWTKRLFELTNRHVAHLESHQHDT